MEKIDEIVPVRAATRAEYEMGLWYTGDLKNKNSIARSKTIQITSVLNEMPGLDEKTILVGHIF